MQLFSALDSDDKGMLNAALLPDVGKALRGKLWSSKMFTAVCSELAMPVSSIRRLRPLPYPYPCPIRRLRPLPYS